MKRKELEKLAQKIAKAESIIQNSSDTKEISKAQQEIMELTGHVTFADLDSLDEMVQKYLEQA